MAASEQENPEYFMEKLHGLSREQQEDALWKTMISRQGCVFHTAKGLAFSYQIRGGELFVDRKNKSITQSSVFVAFHKALELGGQVSGPKKLGTFGASYLYPVFAQIGVICRKED